MRQYYIILSLAVLALAAGACKKEKQSDEDILKGRIAQTSQLEVSFASGGQEVKSLNFASAANHYTLGVNVNNDNLCWTLESDRDWCTVVEEEHKGSGEVTLVIDANESFDPRETATLTFVAGEYRGTSITVDQNATAFLLGQPFFVVPIAGGSYTTKVVTQPGAEWECEGNDWLEITKGDVTSTEEFDIYDVTITSSLNVSDSRYGSVTLTSGLETARIYLWQFGTDYDYDLEGHIFFESGSPAALRFTAPAYSVKDVQIPSFGQAEVTENGDGTCSVAITLQDNLSDCAEVRAVDVSVSLSNASASVVVLPTLVQDYVPAHGLVTGKGLKAFARAIAEGADTSDWERDGEVVMIQDINMEEETGWNGIGSLENPFTGTFNGNGHAVTNLKGAGAGLFNYTKDATIKDVAMGKGTSLYSNSEFNGKAAAGAIVAFAENTSVSGCAFSGEMEVASFLEDDGPIYAGGIVGWADASSSVESCKVSAKITFTSPAPCEMTYYIGGIAGLAEGTLRASEMSGELFYSSAIQDVRLGGIESMLIPGATVGNNTFNGAITLGGGIASGNIGGLYGTVDCDKTFDYAQDKSISMGNIRINAYASSDQTTLLYVGGMVGKAQPGINLTVNGYENKSNFFLSQTASLFARYICIGGILGGCAPEEEDGAVASLRIENSNNTGSLTLRYGSGRSNIRHGLFGGMVGFINGPATLKDCSNNANIGMADTSKDESGTSGNARAGAAANDYCHILGGIAGCAKGGNLVLESCSNGAPVTNLHYTNRPSTSTSDGMYSSQVAGGILGAFSYFPEDTDFTLTITSCTNSANGQVLSFRGYCGGVVGFARNATITGSSSSGFQAAASNDNAYYRGGIAGGARNSSIRDCWAKCNINSGAGGSAEAAFSGGILGWAQGEDPVLIRNCSYNGTLKCTPSGSKPVYPGGIIASASESTVIDNCKYGGVIQDVTISANNAPQPAYAIGNYATDPGCTINGLEYWDGNI